MDARGRLGISFGEELVSPVGAELVVGALPTLPRPRLRRGRKLELGQPGAQVQPRPADDDRGQTLGERTVDRVVCQLGVLPDRGLVVELPDRDELRRPLGLGRQNRNAAVDLHGVGGDQSGGDPLGESLRDGGLA